MIRTLLLALAVTIVSVSHGSHAQQAEPPAFHEQVDLQPLGSMAVHVQGRIKSLGSHANAMMDAVSGPKSIAGQSPVFTYFDMLFRPEAYEDADCIYVKNKLVRNTIADAVIASEPSLTERMDIFRDSGLTSATILDRPEAAALLKRIDIVLKPLAGAAISLKLPAEVADTNDGRMP